MLHGRLGNSGGTNLNHEGQACSLQSRGLAAAATGRVARRAGAAEGWHFLTGKKDQIDALAQSVGFRYAWDPEIQQYAHASGIMLLTPSGRVAQYYYGIEYAPRDIQLGLIEASKGKIGNVVDQVLLYCYHYDPRQGKYGAAVFNILRLSALATVLALGGFMLIMFRRDSLAAREGRLTRTAE